MFFLKAFMLFIQKNKRKKNVIKHKPTVYIIHSSKFHFQTSYRQESSLDHPTDLAFTKNMWLKCNVSLTTAFFRKALKKSSDVAFHYKDIYSFQKTPLRLFSVPSSIVQETTKNVHKFDLCFQTAFCHYPPKGFACCYSLRAVLVSPYGPLLGGGRSYHTQLTMFTKAPT